MKRLVLAAAILFASARAHATEPLRHERAGLVIGAGAGIGRLLAPNFDEQGTGQGVGFAGPVGDVRIGAGVSERLCLFAELIALEGITDSRLLSFHALATAQYFLDEIDPNLFFRGGVGFAGATHQAWKGMAKGVSIGAMAGYEWRFGRVFALSAEVGTYFSGTTQYIGVTPLAQLGGTFYW